LNNTSNYDRNEDRSQRDISTANKSKPPAAGAFSNSSMLGSANASFFGGRTIYPKPMPVVINYREQLVPEGIEMFEQIQEKKQTELELQAMRKRIRLL
jgi:hypothetical protein